MVASPPGVDVAVSCPACPSEEELVAVLDVATGVGKKSGIGGVDDGASRMVVEEVTVFGGVTGTVVVAMGGV